MFELLTPNEMSCVDRLTIESGVPGIALMERAGLAVADAVCRRLAKRQVVLVVCGFGNNGGDGFVAARLLSERGYSVRVALMGDLKASGGDAGLAAKRWLGSVERITPDNIGMLLEESALIVDAIFGIGLDRVVSGFSRTVISEILKSQKPVVAVDLPSGIHGGSGSVMGMALYAVETVTFGSIKTGIVLFPGRMHAGKITVADIGLLPLSEVQSVVPKTWLNVPSFWLSHLLPPKLGCNKYDRGHCVVVSGTRIRTGAARLSAVSALRVGAGLVTIASPPDALLVNAIHATSVMIEEMDGVDGLREILVDLRKNVVVIGPAAGIGEETRELVLYALSTKCAVVIDADAITSFVENPASLFSALHERKGNNSGTDQLCPYSVITPHEGEFSRLFPDLSVGVYSGSKLDRAKLAAVRSNAVIVLKGPDTVVAAPDGRAVISDNGPPYLATAGTGDVLAGIVGGILANSLPPFEACAIAVWIHGEIGNKAGPGLIAEELPNFIKSVLAELYSSATSRSFT